MKSLIRNKKGFTLIEMLIVVVIIGILAAVILPKMGGSSRAARVSSCKANVSSINTGLELIIFENNIVATTVTGHFPATANLTGQTDLNASGAAMTDTLLIAKFPNGGTWCPVRPQATPDLKNWYTVAAGVITYTQHLSVGTDPLDHN